MSEPKIIEQPEARPVVACSDLLEALAMHLRAEEKANNEVAVLLYRSMANGKKQSDKADMCGFFAGIIERSLKSASNAGGERLPENGGGSKGKESNGK